MSQQTRLKSFFVAHYLLPAVLASASFERFRPISKKLTPFQYCYVNKIRVSRAPEDDFWVMFLKQPFCLIGMTRLVKRDVACETTASNHHAPETFAGGEGHDVHALILFNTGSARRPKRRSRAVEHVGEGVGSAPNPVAKIIRDGARVSGRLTER